jgi:choline kinase
MQSNTEAVILAAGDSSRLFPATRDFPKCLLYVGRKTLFTHMIDSFMTFGVKRFSVVAGYKRAKLVPLVENLNARLIANRAYRSTNSLYSLWLTKKAYEGDIIIANSDVYLDPRLLEKILQSSRSCALVDLSSEWDPESTKVKIRRGRILRWSRTLQREEWSGENLGVVKICREHVKPFYDKVDQLIARGHKGRWWPDALNQFARSYRIAPVDTAGMLCKEIDTARDYIELLEKIQITIRA